MKLFDQLALTIVIIAAVHLALVGLLQIDLVTQYISPLHEYADEIFYGAVAISAIWCLKYYGYTPRGGSRLRGR